MKEMSSLSREIRDEAGKEDNFQVANMFEDYISSFSKNLWFISAMLKE